MDENKHLENAREDLLALYCYGCKEFKTECPCGMTYCVFCEFECDCTDGADIERWETTTPPDVYLTDDNFSSFYEGN